MSNRYKGAVISATPPSVSRGPGAAFASGIWTPSQQAVYQAAGTWPLSDDPNFNQTVLLLHGDGTNGAQNNTFLDSSTNNFTITRNGNTTQGTFSPFSLADGEWSVYIGGVDDWVDIVNSGALLGSGAWTMECWFYATTTGVQRQLLDFRYPSGGQNLAVFLQTTNEIAYWNGTVRITGGTVDPNQWNHVLCSRDGSNDVRLFLNGVQIGSAYNDTTNYTTAVCRVGCANTGADFQGYISNVRLVNGSAVQTSGFTVPTSPLTDISGTTFLGLQSNRFVDNSATPVTSVTPNDAVSIQPFSPFQPSSAYSTSVNGGSGYFDGTGDYLTAPSDANTSVGTGDFTLEMWVYDQTTNQYAMWFDQRTADVSSFLQMYKDNDFFGCYLNGTGYGANNVWVLNQWNHCVLSRVSGTSKIFLNGTQIDSFSDTNNYGQNAIDIGASYNTLYPLKGYISGLTLIKGSGVTSVTVPTAPPTAVADTELLLNFTSAGIFDNTGKNNLETVGNAQIDTTTKKWGTGSLEFDGTGDYLYRAGTSDFFVFNSDFTVECWVYLNSNSGTQLFVNYGGVSWYLAIGDITAEKPQFTWANTTPTNYHATGTTSLATGQWYHLAGVKYGSNIYLYVNGVQEAVTAITGSQRSPSTNAFAVGASPSGTNLMNGFIDDLRITKGVARYTAAFTPPNGPFFNT